MSDSLRVLPVEWYRGTDCRCFFDGDVEERAGPVTIRELVAVCRDCGEIPVGVEGYDDLIYPLLAVERACVVPEYGHGNVLRGPFLDGVRERRFDSLIFGTGGCLVPENPSGDLERQFAAPLLITKHPHEALPGEARNYLTGRSNDPRAMTTDALAAALECYDPRVGVIGLIHGWENLGTCQYDEHHHACGGLHKVCHVKTEAETDHEWPARNELNLEFAYR